MSDRIHVPEIVTTSEVRHCVQNDRWLADHDRQVAEKARRDALEGVTATVDEARMLNKEMIAKGTREDDFPGALQYWEGAIDAADWWYARITLALIAPPAAVTPTESNPTPKENEL